MKKFAKHIHLLFLLSAPVVALVTIALRTIALLTSYESDIGRYATPTLATVITAILVAMALLLAVSAHELRDLLVVTADYRDLPTLFAEVFSVIALVFFAVTFPIDAAKSTGVPFAMALVAAILALAGAALFILRALRGETLGAAYAMLALPLALIGIPIVLYLDLTETLRVADPAVLLAVFTWAAVGFFFLGEARIALNRAKWALHTYVTAMTAALTATLAFPNLIYRATVGEPLFGNVMLDFLALAIFLFTMARLLAIFTASHREEKTVTRFVMGVPVTELAPPKLATAEDAATAAAEKKKESPKKENDDEDAADR